MNAHALVLTCFLAPFAANAQEPARSAPPKQAAAPDLEPIHSAVRQLVLRHWPQAKTELRGDTIVFEHDARTFLVHQLQKTGEWSEKAHEVRGPRPGGVYGELRLLTWPGPYMGALATGRYEAHYYIEHRYAPHWAAHDRSFWVELRLPSRGAWGTPLPPPKKFLDEFEQLLAGLAKAPGATLSVLLTDPGKDSMAMIKAVRAVTGLGLAEAQKLVATAGNQPTKIAEGLTAEQAAAARKQLEAAGGQAEIR